MKLLRKLAGLLAVAVFAASAHAQSGASIYGQAIGPTGIPVAGARVYVCPYTASGLPCSPQASVYSDIGLTTPLTQPFSTDQYGNYLAYVTPGAYLVQVQIGIILWYSYVVTTAPGGTLSPGTANLLPKYTATTAIGPSLFGDTGTAGSYTGAAGFTANGGLSTTGVITAGSMIDTGIGTTPSTAPICPNGTGGAFTTSGCVGAGGPFLPLAGGTLNNNASITLQGAGVVNGHATLDLPLTGGTLTGPLYPKSVSGSLYADQYQSGSGNNGIANALSSCGSICNIFAPPSYSQAEAQPYSISNSAYGTTGAPGVKYYPGVGTSGGTWYSDAWMYGPVAGQGPAAVEDLRYGVPQWLINVGTPYPSNSTQGYAGPSWVMNETIFPKTNQAWSPYADFESDWLMGGISAQTSVVYKNNLSTLQTHEWRYTQGQIGGEFAESASLFGNGDFAQQSLSVKNYGGPNMTADEGSELFTDHVSEGSAVFDATLSGISTASDGSTTFSTTSQVNNGTQGEGRMFIDLTSAYNSSSDYVSAITHPSEVITVTFSGATWASFFPGASTATTQTTLTNPVDTQTTGQNDFPESNRWIDVASTTGFTAGNTACTWGYDYDCEKIEAVGTDPANGDPAIQLYTVRLPQPVSAWVTTGGLTGYGLSFTADNCVQGSLSPACPVSPSSGQTIRDVTPIITSNGSNSVTLFSGYNGIPGTNSEQYTGRAYTSMGGSGGSCSVTVTSGAISAVSVSGGTGYITTTDSYGNPLDPPQLVLSGITYTTAPSIYVSGITSGALTSGSIANAGSGISGTPTCTVVTQNAYSIYPSAKTYQVYNPAVGKVDGTIWTEPPSGPFTAGDSVEQPHYFIQKAHMGNFGFATDIPAHTSEPNNENVQCSGYQGSDLCGGTYANTVNPNQYRGWPLGSPGIAGYGQWTPPGMFQAGGPYSGFAAMDTPPFGNRVSTYPYGPPSFAFIGCGMVDGITCANWSYYNWLESTYSTSPALYDNLAYSPSAQTWRLTAAGLGYYFSPTSFNIPGSITGQIGNLLQPNGTQMGTVTNYLIQSNTLSNSTYWKKTYSTFTGGETDPYGGTNAWQVVSTQSDIIYNLVTSGTQLPANSTVTACVWVTGASVGQTYRISAGAANSASQTTTTAYPNWPASPTTVTVTTGTSGSGTGQAIDLYTTGAETLYVAYADTVAGSSGCTPTPAAVTTTTQVLTPAQVTNLAGNATVGDLPIASTLSAGNTSCAAGTGVTSCTCASGYTCTNARGEYTIVGGTATTGTIGTVNFSTTLGAAPFCQTTVNGGSTTFLDVTHGTPSTSSFTIAAGVSVTGLTINVDYSCQP